MGEKKNPYFEIEISKNFPSGISTHIDWKPNTNIIETIDSLLIEIELPGVDKNDISLTLINNQELVVKGIKRQPPLPEGHITYYLYEREFGTFYKKMVIDLPLDTQSIISRMDNGVLFIEIRKKQLQTIAVEIK